RISHENLRLRDPQWMRHFEHWFSEQNNLQIKSGQAIEASEGNETGKSGDVDKSTDAEKSTDVGTSSHVEKNRDPGKRETPPMWTPFRMRSVVLKNRIVVSPMAMYSCTDGIPGEFHFQHLLARALGGAGLVMVEMTCVSPEARITPYCPSLWNQAQLQ